MHVFEILRSICSKPIFEVKILVINFLLPELFNFKMFQNVPDVPG